MGAETSSTIVARVVRDAELSAVLVPDTSVLLENPDLSTWDPAHPCLIVIPTVVLAELDHQKGQRDSKPAQAEAAQRVLTALADAAAATSGDRSLKDGLQLSSGLWVVSLPADRQRTPPELDPKKNDHQIAAVAWMLQQDIRTIPVVLLTADHGQTVFASGAGVDCFLERRPFDPKPREQLSGLIGRLSAAPASLPEPLEGYLPPRESVMSTFIGRKAELADLYQWLHDPEVHKWALVGDGGKGKTAIAYEFASQVKRSNPSSRLRNVVWLSAKRRRLVEHTLTDITPDFVDLAGALDFLLDQFGETESLENTREKGARVREFLNLFPSLIVVDDIDSISAENADVRAFFTDLVADDVKILFTSRRELFGLETRETIVRGLAGDEASAFIHDKAREFGLDPARFSENTDKLVKVTDGSPLYLEDLLRFCRITTVEKAIQQWESRGGEKARQYALEREIEELTRSYEFDRHVLIACALHEGPVSATELGTVLNRSQEDVEEALEHLRQFFLLPEATISEELVLFEMSRNTRALVQAIYGKTDEARKMTGAFTALGKHHKEKGEDARIGAICRHGRLVAQSGKLEESLELLQELGRRYPERPQILQQLGWIYKIWKPPQFTNAREAFARAHALGYRSIDLYWHWAELEEIDGRFKQAGFGEPSQSSHPIENARGDRLRHDQG